VHMSEFVYIRTGIGIMRHVRIKESPVFTLSTFSPGITISRSLEGKYTFLGGICWVLCQEGQDR